MWILNDVANHFLRAFQFFEILFVSVFMVEFHLTDFIVGKRKPENLNKTKHNNESVSDNTNRTSSSNAFLSFCSKNYQCQ